VVRRPLARERVAAAVVPAAATSDRINR
jgi:hypothetical protein